MKILNLLWKNAEYVGMDWGLTGWGWLLLAVLIIAGIVWICREVSKLNKQEYLEQCLKIKKLGYADIDDIEVFLSRIDADLDDFIASKGLRKQYEIFAGGKSSTFIEKFEAHKKADDAESVGRSSGLVTGLIIGTTMNAGNR